MAGSTGKVVLGNPELGLPAVLGALSLSVPLRDQSGHSRPPELRGDFKRLCGGLKAAHLEAGASDVAVRPLKWSWGLQLADARVGWRQLAQKGAARVHPLYWARQPSPELERQRRWGRSSVATTRRCGRRGWACYNEETIRAPVAALSLSLSLGRVGELPKLRR